MYEIGTDYGFVGQDDDDMVDEDTELAALLGQWPRRPGGRAQERALTRRAMQVARAVKRVEQGTLLAKTEPTKSREFPIGFDSGAAPLIAAGAAATLTQRPQIVFRGERIVIPAAVAAFFVLTDVRVGKNSQLVSAGNIPAATFAETAFGVRLKMDTCQISQDLILQVVNIDVAAHRFLAAVIGESVE
jgi:hypothetical protein